MDLQVVMIMIMQFGKGNKKGLFTWKGTSMIVEFSKLCLVECDNF